ncbi:hypothetical protein PVAP13_4NG013300 [Panicum virgatum]|uniref:Pentatricopeptide repeat-containing protein n=1 Tax=Panicum virgatum TaxID=38727 RepID=A0A8T0T2B7_PANVG|nr:hypothetical protein PVAP13_4NG013300 [Panicum virgatum]
MAPYPFQQKPLHLPHSSKPATPIHDRLGHGDPRADAVSASLRQGAPTDARGLRALIKAVSASSSAAAVHAHAAKLGLDRERTVRNSLIALYLARGDRAAAGALFQGFPDGRDVVSWTAMVTGHARLGFSDDAVALFLEMADGDCGVAVDAVAAAAGFAACAEVRDLALAREAHRRVTARPVELDVVAWNALVDMYAKCGDVAAAHRWFRAMPANKTVVSWNTMISAFARAGEHGEALALFREMQRAGVHPDDATLVAVLGALDTGRWVHAYMRRRLGRREADGVVGNALLDMYAKCGAVDQAVAVFDGMARRDVYTYASMILGLATHGRAEDALALFAAMRRAGVRPNGVALLGVLPRRPRRGRAPAPERHGAVPRRDAGHRALRLRRRHARPRGEAGRGGGARGGDARAARRARPGLPPRGLPGARRRRASRAADAVHERRRRRLQGLRAHVQHVRLQGTARPSGAGEEEDEEEQSDQGTRVQRHRDRRRRARVPGCSGQLHHVMHAK